MFESAADADESSLESTTTCLQLFAYPDDQCYISYPFQSKFGAMRVLPYVYHVCHFLKPRFQIGHCLCHVTSREYANNAILDGGSIATLD